MAVGIDAHVTFTTVGRECALRIGWIHIIHTHTVAVAYLTDGAVTVTLAGDGTFVITGAYLGTTVIIGFAKHLGIAAYRVVFGFTPATCRTNISVRTVVIGLAPLHTLAILTDQTMAAVGIRLTGGIGRNFGSTHTTICTNLTLTTVLIKLANTGTTIISANLVLGTDLSRIAARSIVHRPAVIPFTRITTGIIAVAALILATVVITGLNHESQKQDRNKKQFFHENTSFGMPFATYMPAQPALYLQCIYRSSCRFINCVVT